MLAFSMCLIFNGPAEAQNFQVVSAENILELMPETRQLLHFAPPEVDEVHRNALNKIIAIDIKDVPMEVALKQIAEVADMKIAYSKNVVEAPWQQSVSIRHERITILGALYEALGDTGLKLTLSSTSGEGHLVVVQGSVKEVESLQTELTVDVYQEIVTGTVTDAQTGESLPGVNILIQGTSTGTSTDADGNFELEVPDLDETLIITYIGYERQEVQLEGRSELNIELISSVISGDELVVVGYGIQRRSDLTGSVSSIPQERLDMVPNVNINQAIQGAVPGVMVRTTSAGAAPSEVLMIRGRNSIEADNSPLIVVDGVTYGGNISDINPDDIQSIEVLKDASAAAIYGSRGANGVILLTTKEGTQGETRLTYNSHFSIQRYANLPNVMNGEEFIEFREERFPGVVTQSEIEVLEAGNSVEIGRAHV